MELRCYLITGLCISVTLSIFGCGYLYVKQTQERHEFKWSEVVVKDEQASFDTSHTRQGAEENKASADSFRQTRSFQDVNSSALYYCNFPSLHDKDLSEEGLKPHPDSVLKQVLVVIRHGDRSPLKKDLYMKLGVVPDYCQIKPGNFPTPGILSTFAKVMKEDQQIMAARGQKLPIPPMPNSGECGGAMLSQLGVVQHLHNGLLLRDSYIQRNNLLANALHNRNLLLHKVHAVTTTRSRTMQSAVALLYGIIPNFRLPQVRLQFSASDTFNFQPCGILTKMVPSIKNVQYQSYLKHRKLPAFRKLADTYGINDHSGVLVDGFINGFLCKNITIPCQNGVCVALDDLNQLIDAEEYTMRQVSEKSAFVNHSMLRIQPLLGKLSNFMLKRSLDDSAPELVLFSGHDTTLKPLVRALGIPEFRWPRLGSRLVFELWSSPTDKEGYIKILFNGKDYTMETTPCRSAGSETKSNISTCLTKHFHEYVKDGIPMHFGAPSRQKACSGVT